MSLIILSATAGDFLTDLGLKLTGGYEILSMLILIIIFAITYLFGREVFALLATSLVAVGMSVWSGDFNRFLLALVAVVFGVFIVLLIYRITNR